MGRRNKPTEAKSKEYIYERHLRKMFGEMRLDEIRAGEVAAFRASLVESGRLGEKRINNVLAVLSKAPRVESSRMPSRPATRNSVAHKQRLIGHALAESTGRSRFFAASMARTASINNAAVAKPWQLCRESGVAMKRIKKERAERDVKVDLRQVRGGDNGGGTGAEEMKKD